MTERTFQDVINTIVEGEFYGDYDQSSADIGVLRSQADHIDAQDAKIKALVEALESALDGAEYSYHGTNFEGEYSDEFAALAAAKETT